MCGISGKVVVENLTVPSRSPSRKECQDPGLALLAPSAPPSSPPYPPPVAVDSRESSVTWIGEG